MKIILIPILSIMVIIACKNNTGMKAVKKDSTVSYPGTNWEYSKSISPNSDSLDGCLSAGDDKEGEQLDGEKYYQLHIPGVIPAKEYWSITVYDETTHQPIQNDEPRNSFHSNQPTYLTNGDGSVDVFFGQIAPAGEGTNWIRTLPNKEWFAVLCLNKPTQPYFDHSWKLGDIERVSEKVWMGQSVRRTPSEQ